MAKEYRNVTRSKNALRNALVDIIARDIPVEEISVSDLCEEANVNRGTFYNHFGSIADLITDMENLYLDVLESTIRDYGFLTSESRRAFFYKINEIIEENKNVALAIAKAMPATFRADSQKKIAEVNKRYFKATFPLASNSLKMSEIDVVSAGIASLYSAVIVGSSDLSTTEVADAAAALFDLLAESYR